MKIAVCIPTFNQAAFLPLAIASALNQNKVETEVWIADDCSTDETESVVQQFLQDDRVHYCRNAENLGIAANVNQLLRQPKTEFIIRLDSDDVLLSDYCHTLASLLKKHPTAAIAHAAVQEINKEGTLGRKRLLARSTIVETGENALRSACKGYKVAANICMFRRSSIEGVPFCRTGMNFGEDWDLFARLADLDWGNIYCGKILSHYRVWNDAGGYREGRKAVELEGIIRLFEETLEPAWKSRGWDFSELTGSRRSFARVHCSALFEISRNSEDYHTVYNLLLKLAGDEELVSRELSKSRLLPKTIRNLKNALRSKCKDSVKELLYLLRREK